MAESAFEIWKTPRQKRRKDSESQKSGPSFYSQLARLVQQASRTSAPGRPAVVAGAQQKQIPVSRRQSFFLQLAAWQQQSSSRHFFCSISWLQKGLSSYSQLSSYSYMKKVCVFVLCLDSDKYLHVFFNGQKQLSSLLLSRNSSNLSDILHAAVRVPEAI